MNTETPSSKPSRWRALWKLLALGSLVWVIAVAMVAIEVATLSRDANVLRDEMLAITGRPAAARIQFTVGPALLSATRLGLGLAHDMPAEALQALEAARSASVGVYTLKRNVTAKDRARMFVAASEAMSRRGWTRLVGVNNADATVTIYAPTTDSESAEQRLCLAVCEGGKLIVVDATVNRDALVKLASHHLPRFAAQ